MGAGCPGSSDLDAIWGLGTVGDGLRHWGPALDDRTELWLKEHGLMRERWVLWGQRPWASSMKGILNEEIQVVVTKAAEVVSGILGEDSTEEY